jgi:hypothetical protein
MPGITVSDNEGKPVRDLRVTIAFAKKHAPFKHFKLLSLDRKVDVAGLTGLQAKVLLVLLFSPMPLATKEIAALVGSTTNAACRALSSLTTQGLVVKVSHGLYYVKSDLAHFGKWNVRSIQHPQNRDGTE